jgi:cytochrome c oxidase subunit 5b
MRTQSGGPPAPQIFGPGGKAGGVPTDIEQATGLERLQLLGDMEGINVFDDSPLDSSRLGTKANPVLVPCLVCARPVVSCHRALWLTTTSNRIRSVLLVALVSLPTPMTFCGST